MLDDEAWRAARAAWPGVEVAKEELVAFVEQRMDSSKPADAHVPDGATHEAPSVRYSDLYLACACSRGDSAAIVAFERAYFSEVDVAVRRARGVHTPPVDEVRQMVRHKLFVAEPGQPPKVASYSGRGDLRSWFRVTVSRLILNLQTRPSPEIPFEDTLLCRMLGVADPSSLEFPKEMYKAEFRTAFAEAFDALGDRERSLLRYAFGEELTVELIGSLYGVHKTTAARWVVRAHQALLAGVRSILVPRLGIAEDEYESILRVVRDSLELSLERYLKTPAPGAETV
jgi:RNA polymerase sigma-70 factor, ECF subfamily